MQSDLCHQGLHHQRCGAGVQIAGGFIRQQQGGPVHQRPRNGDPLQLPATKLLRQAAAQATQADGFQHGFYPCVIGCIQKQQRQSYVLGHVQVRQHMKGLEHKTHFLAAQGGAGVILKGAQICAVQLHGSTVPVVQPGHAVEQGGLANARFPDDGNKLARCHFKRYVGKHRGVVIALGELVDAQDHGCRFGWVRSTSRTCCST